MKHNENVVVCPPCGESTLKGGKGVVNKGTLMDNPPSALRATSPAGGEVNGGFTLIELLVVVLIIGILAAVAVPQYQKAVQKSRLSKMITSARSLYEAQEHFRLNNGELSKYLSNLDIDFGGTPVTAFSNYERCHSKGGAVWTRAVADGVIDVGDYEVGLAGPYSKPGASAAALKDKCLFILFLHAPDAHAGEALCYDAGDDIDLCSKYFNLGAKVTGNGGGYGSVSRSSHVIPF